MKNLRLASSIFCSGLIALALAVGTFGSTASAAAQTAVTAKVDYSLASQSRPGPMASGLREIGTEFSGLRRINFVARNVGECWQRMGPYAMQDTAWRRWREARDEGYQVSNGIYRCDWDGYCFTVYFPC